MAAIPKPSGSLIQWALANPQAVSDAIDILNKLQAIQVRLVAPTGPQAAGTPLLTAGSNMTLLVPIQFSQTIQTVTIGGTTDANCRATVNAILAALSQVGINP